jgi:TonB-linked SusC/RagA family outer membrane protein
MKKPNTFVRVCRFLPGIMALCMFIPVIAQDGYTYSNGKTKKKNSVAEQQDTNAKQSLINVLKELNRIKGIFFLYGDKSLGERMVNPIKDMQADVEKILDEVLKNTGLKYRKISANTFVIVEQNEKTAAAENYVGPDLSENMNATASRAEQISGRVADNSNNPLSGVSVSIKGTTRGTTTNNRGEFLIEANKGDVLVISSIGYTPVELTIGDDRSLSITLVLNNQQLNEVVVTALGIRKERKSLGYSVTEVKGNELTQAREINVGNSLIGKVAGVNVNSVSGGPGSSTSIIIRGVSSLSGNNQPLYVINGVPMNNDLSMQNSLKETQGQYYNSPDLGDGIQNINPDDIETISVLKGSAASALYGSRAKAGVILITTKNGSGKGTVEFNSNFVLDQVMDVTDWQYQYGNGANGLKPTNATAAYDAGNSSWGAKLDGSPVVQFDGTSRPYSAQKKNIENFYRTGNTFTNTLSFGRAFDGGSVRFSVSNLTNQSVLPNSGLDRVSLNLSTTYNVTKRLTIDAKANFISDKAKNRPILADGAGNANFQVMFLPTTLDVNTLKPGTKANGDELLFTNNTYATNPWFATSKFINNTLRNRLIGSVSGRYAFDNDLFIQLRVGRDYYNDRYTSVVPNGAGYYAQAFRNITEQFNRISEINADVLVGKTFKLRPDIKLSVNAGANLMKARAEGTVEGGTDFAVPYVYTILNAKNKTIDYTDFRQEVQSIYAMMELDYKGFLFLNASGRNDWFSTLAPSDDLDVFYPSVNASFMFTEFVKPSWLTYGKLRFGWANVGGSVSPYQTLLNYGLFPQQLNGLPLGQITNTSIPNSALKPSLASEIEIGAELRLFNKVNVDIAWYNKKSKNEIVSAPASNTSGYTGVFLNVGELQNRGLEALISAKVLDNKSGLNWSSSLNGSINKNTVNELSEGQAELAVGTSRTGNGFTRNIVGLAANQVMAFDYKYDNTGKIVLAANGVPERGDLIAMGSAYHKHTIGWNNEFTWKSLNFGFLIDGKFGGKVFSATDYYGYFFGLHQATLVNREGVFGTNTNSNAYYTQLAANVSKLFVYDASFIKFRQLTIGYTLPGKLFGNKIKGATISIVGRNLFIIMKKTDNIDPEASYAGYTQGLELGGVPPFRSYGLNLNVKL